MNYFYVPALIFWFSVIITVVNKCSCPWHSSFPTPEVKELQWHWDMDSTNYESSIFSTGR